MDLNSIKTEQRNSRTAQIDTMSTLSMVKLINEEDKKVAVAVGDEAEHIAQAVDVIAAQLKQGGRLVYSGCGTSGRLGILDAVECPPTYSTDPGEVIGLIAGGNEAIFRAKEGEYRIYVMLPYDAGRNFEIYQGEVAPGAQMESESHGENTWEYLTVVSGEVELYLEDKSFRVKTGSSLYFASDRRHVYRNIGGGKAVVTMLVTTQR